ncbi:MAG: right-handed parallel beta-helix repeat-containing protein [Thermoleophilia bacterium]
MRGVKVNKLNMCAFAVLGTALVLLCFSGVAQAATAFTITDDATGGDCVAIGSWEAEIKTCTLTSDLLIPTGSDGVEIGSDGVTLNGAGHQITGSGGAGIILDGRNFVTIKSVAVSNFTFGLKVSSSGNSNIVGNTIDSNINQYGIALVYSHSNNIVRNICSNNGVGIYLADSSNNRIVANDVIHNQFGIYLQYSSTNNAVYNNVSIENGTQMVSISPNVVNQAPPVGGNYWGDYDEPDEGCNDVNGDSYCDEPYVFSGGQDNVPWTVRGGWCIRPEITLTRRDVFWMSMADYNKRHLSVAFQIDSLFDVYWDLTLEGTLNSGGVIGLSELGPLEVIINSTSPDLTLKYEVPQGVSSFKTTVYVNTNDACGNVYKYPGPWPGA